MSYYEVLTAAIADLTRHGFDSAERLAYWQARLREAAEKSLGSAARMQEQLREGMVAIYKRLVDNQGALKVHPGVSRFTLERLRPQLHNELEKRILLSADLIKLNREQSIQKTLQRFSGWASSIPKGGSKTTDKVDTKAAIRKSMAKLPFEERRVLIDQGHKLTASINEVIASDGGAIALMWRSHWRQAGYNYRHNHKERDGKVYLLRDSWAKRGGLIKPGPAGYYDEITAVAEEPFCRCYAIFLYNLRDLPDDMLTAKGKKALAEAKAKIAAL